MKSLHSIVQDCYGPKAIFEIKLKNRDKVYMDVSRSNYGDNENVVVTVDAAVFLQLWRNSPYNLHSNISQGNPNTWKEDYKFSDAEYAFSLGFDNPVPLARVTFSSFLRNRYFYQRKYLLFKKIVGTKVESVDFISLSDGITRTIWLLSHGVAYFPVLCSIDDGAKKLASTAGFSNSNCVTVAQLLADYQATL